ncbi:MAG: threonylcarbamoyl-AMP synthase [Chloroflexi bacterium]|nr:threonylcarbamoyl-AMP synthase [Chloroflexota bacterium]
MQTQHLRGTDQQTVGRVADYVNNGHIVVIPTDTVYGVGCDALNEAAICELYRIKQRPTHKAIPILLADASGLQQAAAYIPEIARPYIAQYWPGPLTIILPKHPHLPAVLSEDETIAVRIPGHEIARAVIRAAGGAMAVTSANLSGQPVAETAEQALNYFDGMAAAVLDAGPAPAALASTVLDCTGSQPVILREGPLKRL